MMRHMTTVDYRDGWLCVKWIDTDSSEPIRFTSWYPVRQVPKCDAADWIGREATPIGSQGGLYSMRTADYPCGYRVDLRLLNGGQTTPIAFDRTPIPCPKVRKGLETRYHNGCWEKRLRTGWTAV